MSSNPTGTEYPQLESGSELWGKPQIGPVPQSAATSHEVRDYLTSLLKNRHQLPDDYVRKVVARWTVGGGRELRNYTPQMYFNIFGLEDGWVLYSDIKTEVLRSQLAARTELESCVQGRYFNLVVLSWFMFELSMILAIQTDGFPQLSHAKKVTIFVFACIGGSACVLGSMGLYDKYFPTANPEDRTQRELQVCSRRVTPVPE